MRKVFQLTGFLFFLLCSIAHAVSYSQVELRRQYERHCNEVSDINQHIPVLCTLARECSSVVEIGLRTMNSSWGILEGLAESSASQRSYLGIDIFPPPADILKSANTLAAGNGISFEFWQANDMHVNLSQPIDMLFIDSQHTYCHLTYELEKFSSKVQKIICLHDTSGPWGMQDEVYYTGDYSEYPLGIDRTKRGLWPAVEDFLVRHPEWTLQERRMNNNGFTILRRVE